MKTWKIPVTWRMTGWVDIEGPDPETAAETFDRKVEEMSAEKQFEFVQELLKKEDTLVEEGTIEIDQLFEGTSIVRYMYLFDEKRVTGILTSDGYYAKIGALNEEDGTVEITLSFATVPEDVFNNNSVIDEEVLEYLFSDPDGVETFHITPGNKEKMAWEIFGKLYEDFGEGSGMNYLVEVTYYPELTFDEMFTIQQN